MNLRRSLVSETPALVNRRDALKLLGGLGLATWMSGRVSAAESVMDVPTLAGAQPTFYRFKIGDIEAISFNDGGFVPPLEQAPFGVGQPLEAKETTLHDAFLPTGKIDLPFNVLLLRIAGQLVLIDSGCGSVFGPAGGRLRGQMALAGIKPEQINAVILSHTHGDHFGGLFDENGQIVFKNATHYVGRKEKAFWTQNNPDVSGLHLPDESRREMVSGAQKMFGVIGNRFHEIEAGDSVIDGLEILDAPGHTPGHLAFLISSGNSQLLHMVDAAHHFVLSLRHPDWVLAFDADSQTAEKTRRRIFDRASADRLRVFGAHMPFPSLGHIKAEKNGTYDFVLEPWAVPTV